MSHYSSKEWIDFARGVVDQKLVAAMQKHIDEGCKSCKEESELWSWVKEFGAREAENEPPTAVVNLVKQAISPTPGKVRNRMREIAELIFDSFTQPQLVGVRGATASPRQLLYRAGSVLIDMRMETTGCDTDRFALMG